MEHKHQWQTDWTVEDGADFCTICGVCYDRHGHRLHGVSTTWRKRWQFFMENAGWATPPGRVACASSLANAETIALDKTESGEWVYTWDWDDYIDDSWMSEKERKQEHEWLSVVLKNAEGDVLSSLGGIVDPTTDYRRVIEAELAAEALVEEQKRVAIA